MTIYETTILRDVFMEEIRSLDPGWADLFDASELKRDYGTAVQYMDNILWRPDIQEWIEEVASGNKSPNSLRAELGC
jgi:hypothetical protein